MVTNERIILDGVLKQLQEEVDPNGDPSSFFEFFTAEQVLKDFDLSYDEIETGLVGAGGDGGIDGIYLLINGDLVQEDPDYAHLRKDITIDLIIIQSKTDAGFKETPIERFVSVSNDILNLSIDRSSLSVTYNESLVETIHRFRTLYHQLAARFPTLRLSYVYASKGVDPHPNVERKVSNLEEVVKRHFPDSDFSFQFLGAPELLGLARRRPQRTYKLQLAENPISSNEQVGFVCLVGLFDFFKFIADDSGALQRQIFEANVRDYQGRTQVNDEIQDSLRTKSSEDFWWLNNGVSILATKASLGAKTLTIEDPQIVNGLQTSTEVYNYCSIHERVDDDRKILVRVIVPEEDESRDRIIKATNSQTVVQLSSLRATDRIHRDIEEYFRPNGLFYDRRKNYYKNEGKPRDKIISIPFLAQAIMAIVLQRPDNARARPSSLLKRDDDYKKVFSPSYPIKLYFVCAEVMRRVERSLKLPSLGVASEDRNNLRFYVAMHVVGGTSNSSKLPKEIANFDVEVVDESAIRNSLGVIRPKYMELGGNDQVSKGTALLDALRSCT